MAHAPTPHRRTGAGLVRASALAALTVAALGMGAAAAAAVPTGWSPSTTVSARGVVAVQPASAANARGDAVLAWRARTAAGEVAQVAVHRAGATAWAAPLTLGTPAASVQGVGVAITDGGRILVGWRARVAGASRAFAGTLRTAGTRRRVTPLGPALDASGPVAVAFGGGGLAAAAWIAPGPRSVNNPARRLGRAMVGTTDRAGARWLVRRLDPSVRPPEGAGASDGGPGLAPTPAGGVLAWWDEDDDIRDFVIHAAAISPAGVPGPDEDTGQFGRGPTRTQLAPGADGTAVGLWADNEDFDEGPLLGALSRAASGTWSPVVLPQTFVAGAPRLARRGDGLLGAWADSRGGVSAITGPGVTGPFGPVTELAGAARETRLAGVGLTAAGTGLVVWSSATAATGTGRTIRSVLHPSAASTFPAPLVDSLRVASLVGDPTLALGADGRGVVAFSRGPVAAAAVRASLISLP